MQISETMTVTSAVRTGDGAVVYAAADQDRSDRMITQLQRIIFDAEPVRLDRLDLPAGYRDGLRRPHETANWNLARGASDLGDRSVIDWWTCTDTDAIAATIADRFRGTDSFHRIGKRAEIPAYLERAFPAIGRCGMAALAIDPVWEAVKDEGEGLYDATEQVIENVENGRQFETVFRRFCDRNRLGWYRDTARALGHRRPAVIAELPTLTGMPDFLIDRGTTSSLADWTGIRAREWAPRDTFALVEVKYNQSPLSPAQQAMVARLREHGIDSYVFRGDEEGVSIELLE